MDAYAIIVVVAGCSPNYFWNSLNLFELEAYYKGDCLAWQKIRAIVEALGGELNINYEPAQAKADKAKSTNTRASRLSVAKQLQLLYNKN